MLKLLASLFLTITLGMAQGANAGPYEDAEAAYNRGDLETAVRMWRPLAAQGNALAQYNLGLMYGNGRGVVQDHKEAVKWYRLAADQGNAQAQFVLGVMYEYGRGVPQNYVRAHMWYNLSASNRYSHASKHRDDVATKMTSAQIKQAQVIARRCQASNFKNCD